MATYTTLFACTLPLGSADNARTALDLYLEFTDELRAEESRSPSRCAWTRRAMTPSSPCRAARVVVIPTRSWPSWGGAGPHSA